jgi:hypothetical protein
MLHCNMTSSRNLQLGLEDLLADLRRARRCDDLGRLALVAYCEVRRWARDAGDFVLAEHASELITGSPHASREAFLVRIDNLIHVLEEVLPLAANLGSEMEGLERNATAERSVGVRKGSDRIRSV